MKIFAEAVIAMTCTNAINSFYMVLRQAKNEHGYKLRTLQNCIRGRRTWFTWLIKFFCQSLLMLSKAFKTIIKLLFAKQVIKNRGKIIKVLRISSINQSIKKNNQNIKIIFIEIRYIYQREKRCYLCPMYCEFEKFGINKEYFHYKMQHVKLNLFLLRII